MAGFGIQDPYGPGPRVPARTCPSAAHPSSPVPHPGCPWGLAASSCRHKCRAHAGGSSELSAPFLSSSSSSQVSSIATFPSPTQVSFPLNFWHHLTSLCEKHLAPFAAKDLVPPLCHQAHGCMGIQLPGVVSSPPWATCQEVCARACFPWHVLAWLWLWELGFHTKV